MRVRDSSDISTVGDTKIDFDPSENTSEEKEYSTKVKIIYCAAKLFLSIAAGACLAASCTLIISPAYIEIAANPDYSLLKIILPISAAIGAIAGCVGCVISSICGD